MHCPQCGQQQVSGDVRFCSRCGFPLGGVIELLANGGNLPRIEAQAGKRNRSPRYEGVRQGVLMMFLGAVIVPLLGILNSFQTSGSTFLEVLTAMSAVIFFVGGMMRILYAAIFEEGAQSTYVPNAVMPYVPATAQTQMNAGLRGAALPPAQSIPVSNWRQRPNTAEIVQPPSVTENTTRLLNDQPDQTIR